jgi:hypothetical protein
MTVRRLAAGARARVGAHSLTVRWVVKGDTEARITVYANGGAELGEPEVSYVVEQNVLVLYPTAADVLIAALAPPGSVFPTGSAVQMRVETSYPSEESDLVVCAPVDVGGLTRSEVLHIRRDGDEAVVSTAESVQPAEPDSPGPAPRPDSLEAEVGVEQAQSAEPAGMVSVAGYERRQQLIGKACAAARIGIDRPRAQDSDLRTIVVVIDRSASMVVGLHSGAVEAILSVLAGVGEVFGTRPAVVWGIDAQNASPVGRLTPQSLLDCQEEAFSQLSTGMSLEPLHHVTSEVSDPTLLYVLTDGQLGDADGIIDELSRVRAAPVPIDVHVVALALSSADFRTPAPPALSPADPLADLGPAIAAGLLRLTAVGPGLCGGLIEELQEESVLRRLVRSLVPTPNRMDVSRTSATTNSGVSVS